MYKTRVNTNCYINSSQWNCNYNFSLLPVKYRINFTATIETFVWAMKQVWYYMESGAHRILWTRERVTPYTTNTTGKIQTWRPVLLCISLVASSLRATGLYRTGCHFITLYDDSQASFKRKAFKSKNKLVIVDKNLHRLSITKGYLVIPVLLFFLQAVSIASFQWFR